MKKETLFRIIVELVKQFDSLPNDDDYRSKCIETIWKAFNIGFYEAEALFELAIYWDSQCCVDLILSSSKDGQRDN